MCKLWKSKRLGVLSIVVVSVVLIFGVVYAGVVYADMFTTNVVYAWDIGANPNRFAQSMVELRTDESWMPFWHELRFDTDLYDYAADFPYTNQYTVTIPYTGTGGCTVPISQTRWEGTMDYAQYHTDNQPLGGHGFQQTRTWELVDCDRDGDGDFDGADLSVTPAYSRTTLAAVGDPWIVLLDKDRVDAEDCGGNCEDEIITTLFVTLDADCDGNIDDQFNPITYTAGICFYAEAQSPGPDLPTWKGNPQARITAGGGEKTVNFRIAAAATAITLGSFTARWAEASSQPVILWAAIALFGGASLGVVIWRLRPARR